MSRAGSAQTALLSFPLPVGRVERLVRLWTEAFALTGVGVFITLGWGVRQAGSLSIFLVSASLLPRFRQIASENMTQTLDAEAGSLRANASTAWSLFALFAGVLCGYALVTLLQGPEGASLLFGYALDLVHLHPPKLPGHRFTYQHDLLVHEYTQLISFFGLAFIYRSYAVTLAMAFSGCVWGTALIVAVAPAGPGHAPAELAAGLTAILPTALLESFGLLLSSAAAVLISRGLVLYRLSDARLVEVLRSGLALFATGGLVHLGAVYFEWYVASALIR